MKLHLYNINIVQNKLNKENYLLNEIIVDCIARDSINKTNPIIQIEIENTYGELIPEVIFGNENIDVVFNLPYNDANYAYIEEFERYYYISNKSMYNNKIMVMQLECDDLMSFKSLLDNKLLFIARRTNGDLFLEDNIIQYKYRRNIYEGRYINKVGEYDFYEVSNLIERDDYCVAVSVMRTELRVFGLSNSGENYNPLPRQIQNGKIPNATPNSNLSYMTSYIYLIKPSMLNKLIHTIKDNDALASFIQSICILPFTPSKMERTLISEFARNRMMIGGGYIDLGDEVYFATYGDNDVVKMYEINIPEASSYRDLEPYTTATLYIPFAETIEIDLNASRGKKLSLYYYFDYQNQNSMYMLYNETLGKLEKVGNVDCGIDFDLSTTNKFERDRNISLQTLSSVQRSGGYGISTITSGMKQDASSMVGNILSLGLDSAIDAIKRGYYSPPLTASTKPIDANTGSFMPLSPYLIFNQSIMTFTGPEYQTYIKNIGLPFNRYAYITDIEDNEHIVVADTSDLVIGKTMTTEEFNNFRRILQTGFYK